MNRLPVILAAVLGGMPALAVEPQVPPPLPGRGEAERTSPSVRGLTTRPVGNPNALSGPDAPIRIAPGSHVEPDRRPDPKTPGRPLAAGPDPLTILRQPEPLVPVDASIEDRNTLDTSLRVLSPETSWPTGFRVPYEHPDDPNYSVRLDGALMLVYQDGLYTRRGGRTVVGMPPGAWYVIGRDDLRPRVRSSDPPEPEDTGPDLHAQVLPVPTQAAARSLGVRLDLRVIPSRPEPPPAAAANVASAAPPSAPVDPPVAPTAAGLRILHDDSYRRRFLHQLLERFDAEGKPVTAPAGW